MEQQNQDQTKTLTLPLIKADESMSDLTRERHSSKNERVSREKEMAHRLSLGAINHIQSEIINSKLVLESQQANHILLPATHVEQDHPKLSTIIKRKQQLDQQMNRLKYEESRMKERKRNSVDKNMRSHTTKDEMKSIHKVLEAQKEFEEEVSTKTKQLQEKIRAKQIAEELELKRKMEQNSKKKQQEALQHIQNLKIKQQEREKKIKQLNNNYQLIKKKKFLHEQIEQRWKKEEDKQKARQKTIIEQIKKEKEFSIHSIIQHEKKYKTFINTDEQTRKEKLKKEKMMKGEIEKETLHHYQTSKFLQTIFEEEKKKKEEETIQESLFKKYVENRLKYGQTASEINRQKIRNHHLSSIKEAQKQQKDKKPEPSHKSYKSLNPVELAQLGNAYMREVHSSIGHIEMKKSDVKKNIEKEQQKYKDYLQQAKRRRSLSEKNHNPQLKQMRELKEVMKKSKKSEDKLYFAKIIANKLESRAGNDTNLLLQSINARISIINQFAS